jgi:hypothetical protein
MKLNSPLTLQTEINRLMAEDQQPNSLTRYRTNFPTWRLPTDIGTLYVDV